MTPLRKQRNYLRNSYSTLWHVTARADPNRGSEGLFVSQGDQGVDAHEFTAGAKAYAPNLRRTMPARPTRPVPISIRLLGSGTADVVICSWLIKTSPVRDEMVSNPQ